MVCVNWNLFIIASILLFWKNKKQLVLFDLVMEDMLHIKKTILAKSLSGNHHKTKLDETTMQI